MGLNWGLIWFESGYGNSLAGWQQSYTWREFNLNPSREARRHQGGVETRVLQTRGCIVPHFALTYTRKVALYHSRCVVIKLCTSMLSDVGCPEADRPCWTLKEAWAHPQIWSFQCIQITDSSWQARGLKWFFHTDLDPTRTRLKWEHYLNVSDSHECWNGILLVLSPTRCAA